MPAKKKPEKKSTSKKSTKEEKSVILESDTIDENETEADKLRREGLIATYALSNKTIHRNVRDISVSNLTVTFHGTPLIEEAELTLNYGNRYGFIGRNGCGKSTFMRVIGARCFPIPEGIEIFHLKEEIEATDMTAKEAVMSVDVERNKLEREAEQLNELMIDEKEGEEDIMERLTQIYERLEELDATTAEVRASKILSGLGFTPEKQAKKTKEFSGGWRMRIALARALFIQPTLLLLDEPTNHLDMEAVVWLEDYLSKWDKILFMVSHSQDFMNNVCTHIVNLSKKQLIYYTGNYDQFVVTKSEKQEEQEKRYKAEQDQIKHMKDYVAKFGQGNAKMARQAQSKEKVLDKMLRSGLTEKVETEKPLDFKFQDPGYLPPPVLQCNSITFGYPGCEILYSNVDFGIDLDSRVALVGPNGAGKSTLLKIMTGELLPVVGDVRPHAHLRISKFSQHFIDVLDLTQNPLDYFLQLWPDMTREEGRKFLGRYGISGVVQTQVMGQLSDGQKSRVVLAKMAKEMPHLLFLDEPTNHLDMESIDSLAKAINSFGGGMVLVSHDMRLISQVAKEIWLCDNKTVTKYAGEISDFKMQLRCQMQNSNLIDGGSTKMTVPLVPLTPMKKGSSVNNLIAMNQKAVKDLVVASDGSGIVDKKSVSSKGATKKNVDDDPFPPLGKKTAEPRMTEEDLIMQARMERADAAIARQRARQAAEKATNENQNQDHDSNINALSKDVEKVEIDDNDKPEDTGNDGGYEGETSTKSERDIERELARQKRKAEKEAKAALEKREEEERNRRKAEKLRDMEEAKLLMEQKQKEHEEWLKLKAMKEAKQKEKEEEENRLKEELLAKRKAEKEAKREAKRKAKAEAEEKARKEAERRVMEDPWTQEQQVAFENALLTFTVHCQLDKFERWTKIAEEVDGKNRNQCLARYKFLKDYVRSQKKIAAIDTETILF